MTDPDAGRVVTVEVGPPVDDPDGVIRAPAPMPIPEPEPEVEAPAT